MAKAGLNLPNALTLSRIALTGVFMIFLFNGGFAAKAAALTVFLLASYTDFIDGKIARQTGQITGFGKLMDPIADKVLTLSAFLAFVQMGLVPAWMVMAIILRDLLITGLRLLMPTSASQAARDSGKHKTVLQFAAIVGVLIFLMMQQTPLWRPEWTQSALRFIYWSMFFIVAITLWSGVRYVSKNRAFFEENFG